MIHVTATVAGRITYDPELKKSAKDNPYVHLTLEERVGHGEHTRAQTIHVWAWGNLAEQLNEAGVGKGSLIWVSGSLELSDFIRRDGTHDKALKLKLKDWGPVGPEEKADIPIPEKNDIGPAGVIDGERETLPY